MQVAIASIYFRRGAFATLMCRAPDPADSHHEARVRLATRRSRLPHARSRTIGLDSRAAGRGRAAPGSRPSCSALRLLAPHCPDRFAPCASLALRESSLPGVREVSAPVGNAFATIRSSRDSTLWCGSRSRRSGHLPITLPEIVGCRFAAVADSRDEHSDALPYLVRCAYTYGYDRPATKDTSTAFARL